MFLIFFIFAICEFVIFYFCKFWITRINLELHKLSKVTRQVYATDAKRSFGILLSRKEEQVVGLKYHARVPGIPARNSFISF